MHPQRSLGAIGCGVDRAAGQGGFDQESEIPREDLPAGIWVANQPFGLGQIGESIGDDLAERIGIRRTCGNDLMLLTDAPGQRLGLDRPSCLRPVAGRIELANDGMWAAPDRLVDVRAAAHEHDSPNFTDRPPPNCPSPGEKPHLGKPGSNVLRGGTGQEYQPIPCREMLTFDCNRAQDRVR
jgi:hypothetical protein